MRGGGRSTTGGETEGERGRAGQSPRRQQGVLHLGDAVDDCGERRCQAVRHVEPRGVVRRQEGARQGVQDQVH